MRKIFTFTVAAGSFIASSLGGMFIGADSGIARAQERKAAVVKTEAAKVEAVKGKKAVVKTKAVKVEAVKGKKAKIELQNGQRIDIEGTKAIIDDDMAP